MKRLRYSFYLFILTVTCGVLGYHYIEDMSVFDSIYMTAITISTVGFEETKPLSTAGRTLTMFIIIFGITIAGYTLGNFIKMLVEGEISKGLGRKKVEKRITNLKNHYIVCGHGRIGKLISRELQRHNEKFIILEKDEKEALNLESANLPYLALDARDETSLLKAGIMRARGLVTAVMSDADNVFITLTAKMLNPDIFILARASDFNNEKKMLSAGANKVVSPYMIGGQRMAQVLVKPTVVDFIDLATMDHGLGLMMEEMKISDKSVLSGKSLISSNLRKDFGVIIVLIKKHNGELKFNPHATEILESGDVLVMLGKTVDLDKISKIV